MRRKWIVGAVAALGVAFAPAATSLADTHRPPAAPVAIAAKSCAGYVKATIGGETKCLRRGQYCAVAYRKQYRRYGFTCSGSPARLH